MKKERKDLSERLLNFAADVIKLLGKLNKTAVGRHIGYQLLKASTSSGANYEEACGAESKADFIHKMQLVLKESRESLYWLKLIKKANLISDGHLQLLLGEVKELVKIVAKSVVTAKSK
jgi:four helix bundle protein